VVVTRAAEQASTLVGRLREKGATVIEVPTIAIAEPLDGGAALAAAVDHVDTYDWVVLTSTNGAARFLAALAASAAGAADRAGPAGLAGPAGAADGDRPTPAVAVAVVGPGTAAAVRAAGIEPALVPERFVAEGLLAAFPPGPGRVLLPQAEAARPVLADGLAAAGWTVDAVVAYRTVAADVAPALLERARGADAITFTSGSTVTGYLAAAGAGAVPAVVACIGPVTADAATAAGIAVTAVAAEHTIDGLVAALEASLPT
jgi:uroporphyrinogen-III synthase